MWPRLWPVPKVLHGRDLEMPGMWWTGFLRQAPFLFLHHLLRQEEAPRSLWRVSGVCLFEVQVRGGVPAPGVVLLPTVQKDVVESGIHKRKGNPRVHEVSGETNSLAGSHDRRLRRRQIEKFFLPGGGPAGSRRRKRLIGQGQEVDSKQQRDKRHRYKIQDPTEHPRGSRSRQGNRSEGKVIDGAVSPSSSPVPNA